MEERVKLFEWRTAAGDSLTVDDVILTPKSQALIVRWPSGGMVWNRPVAVEVQRGDQTESIPLVDITRVIQFGLIGLSLVFLFISALVATRRN